MFGSEIAPFEILKHYWLIFPVGIIAALIATPIFRKLAFKYGILDMPNTTVKTHKEPTAYLGGLGILCGTIAGLVAGIVILCNGNGHTTIPSAFQLCNFDHGPAFLIIATGIGAIIACIVGLLDDIYDLKPGMKFAGQAISALPLIIAGIRPDLQTVCQYLTGWDMPNWIEIILTAPVTLFFILAATNSLNLLDGLDGLCGGVTAIITVAFFVFAWSLASWNHNAIGDTVRIIVSLALVGGVLGFLPFNYPPAKIFMGDAGSMLLGYISGALMIMFADAPGRWTVGAIIIFGLPIMDTATALIRRYVNKKPLFLSDRGHIYDQLVDRGISKIKTVKICYLLSIIYAIAGLSMSVVRLCHSLIAFILIFSISFYIVKLGGFLQIPEKKDN
ncbi:MAG: undecaprenyl/decaprenyl-phosphate alpha-N-acetylglucosaminyl 1-phosphate transferase [Sedimentisphaerales bacterium]|nr:undecaprenyl/decaprenyl-phosphate alpha-N-acetylglucosaminyl 1-phosphate transferase [Sedimentisphaerales bacterium]